MKDTNDDINNADEIEEIGLLDTEELYVDSDDDIDIFENKDTKGAIKKLKNKDDDNGDDADDADDDDYILNDYGTSEIEESELIIDDMGDLERDDYWTEGEEGYEGIDIEEL